MDTAVSIFQLLLMTKMLIICCSAVDVYLSTTKQTWDASHNDSDCILAKSSEATNYTVLQSPTLAWVSDNTIHSVWINMTGCFNVTSISSTIKFRLPCIEDPIIFCLRKCDSEKMFLTSTECYCDINKDVTGFPRCQGSKCQNHDNRLCGYDSRNLNGTKCVCGYAQQNDISTKEPGKCMSTKIYNDKFINQAQNCSEQMDVLCSNNQNKHTILFEQHLTWAQALNECHMHGEYFTGVGNGSRAGQNTENVLWVGMFKVEVQNITCMAMNLTGNDSKTVQLNCSLPLPSLCINQTATTSTKRTTELTATSFVTSKRTSPSSVTTYPSTLKVHSFPKEQETKISSSVLLPIDAATPSTTGWANPSTGSEDHNSHTTGNSETSTLPTTRGLPKENPNRKPSSEFPTRPVIFGVVGTVVLFIVAFIFIVFFRMRKQHRNNESQNSDSELHDGNSTNTQKPNRKTIINDDINEHSADNRILSNVHSVGEDENADYDHFETRKTRESGLSSRWPAGTYSNNVYDHLGKNGNAYCIFPQKNESETFSEGYDHIARNSAEYDHIRTRSIATVDHEVSDYGHTRNGKRLWNGRGIQGTGERFNDNIAAKNGNMFPNHLSMGGNSGNKVGSDQWDTRNSDGAQYDHLPRAMAQRDTSYPPEGDYDHTPMVSDYDHIGKVTERQERSYAHANDYDHVTGF